jgi:hypothetical protein
VLAGLTVQQSRALLDRIAPSRAMPASSSGTAIEEAVAETPLVASNATRLLIDGEQTLPPCSPPCTGQTSINLEYPSRGCRVRQRAAGIFDRQAPGRGGGQHPL